MLPTRLGDAARCYDAALRARASSRVRGPDAAGSSSAMVSNDVEALASGESCEALLLTPKARVIAPFVVWRRGEDDFLLLTEPALGEVVRASSSRMRFARSARSRSRSTPPPSSSADDAGRPRSRRRDYGSPRWSCSTPRSRRRRPARRRRARAAADPGGHARARPRDRRPRPSRRGGPRRARDQLHEGLLPGPGAGARLHYRGHAEPRSAGARDRRRRAASPRRRAPSRREGSRPVTSAAPIRTRHRRARATFAAKCRDAKLFVQGARALQWLVSRP